MKIALFRSGGRDKRRFDDLARYLNTVLREVENEFKGLNRRVEAARVSAAFRFGNDSGSQSTDATDVQALMVEEQTLITGTARLLTLKEQAGLIRSMIVEVDGKRRVIESTD